MTSNTHSRSRISEKRRQELSQQSRAWHAHRAPIKPTRPMSLQSTPRSWLSTVTLPASLQKFEFTDFTVQYVAALPRLLLGIMLYLALFYIVTTIYPDQIANWLVYRSYLLLLFIFYLANFFLLSFIFLNRRRGALFSSVLTMILFLLLQDVVIPLHYLIGGAISLALAELVLGVSKNA